MYELSPLRTEKYPIFIIAGLKHRYCSLSACYPKKLLIKMVPWDISELAPAGMQHSQSNPVPKLSFQMACNTWR